MWLRERRESRCVKVLKGESKKNERRAKLKEMIYQRFDFTEMAKRSLDSEWRRRSPEEQKEFVKLFTDLLERAYLDQIESYNGEKIQLLKELDGDNYADVATKIIDNKGQEYSVNYQLHKVSGDWKVYDVVIEGISLVNNYRSQFRRVLAKSSYEELVSTMKGKTLIALIQEAKLLGRRGVSYESDTFSAVVVVECFALCMRGYSGGRRRRPRKGSVAGR
ncbi:MAG TPA: ABC transporter substrate-binding protein [Pyrinomonadaceae bacterium]|nr:ABC transporter substrate-binding protein [Pyrinomonadaceae bacterium]